MGFLLHPLLRNNVRFSSIHDSCRNYLNNHINKNSLLFNFHYKATHTFMDLNAANYLK